MKIRKPGGLARIGALALVLVSAAAIILPGTTNAASITTPLGPRMTQTQELSPATPAALGFTTTSDLGIQLDELDAYVEANSLSRRVVQVDLTKHRKISQFAHIDATVRGYGLNACGLVAAAAAMGGSNWHSLVEDIADAAGDAYSGETGIQPSNYVNALTDVFGIDSVTAINKSSLGTLYEQLGQGNIVIVDLKVNAATRSPSATGSNYAHFARVLGVDLERKEIYIENTLRGGPYWTLSLIEFLKAWEYPETTSDQVPDPKNAEDVTRWMVVLEKPELLPQPDISIV